MSVPIAIRQLSRYRARAIAGIIGVAVSLLLALALTSIFAGVEGRLTAFLTSTHAEVVVAEQGVSTMHMTQSTLNSSQLVKLKAVRGVDRIEPILYASAMVTSRDLRGLVYLVGSESSGISRTIIVGRPPQKGEIVIDEALADTLGVRIRDKVRLLGHQVRVSGMINGTAAITNSVAFVPRADLARTLNTQSVASYVFIHADQGISQASLAQRINSNVPGVKATTLPRFIASERRVISDMGTDIIHGMVLAGIIIGIAVTSLISYTLTLSQHRDFVTMRALGMNTRRAALVVIAQTSMIVGTGFVLALVIDLALALALPRLSPTLALDLRASNVATTATIAIVAAGAGALLPLWRVVTIQPAAAFRG